eukprot:COSAG03_NODE_1375_length_4216_cov_3.811513_1_plen_70_part_00
MLVTRAYAVPARSNMFLGVQWGYRRENDDADGTFRLHPNYGLFILSRRRYDFWSTASHFLSHAQIAYKR